MIRPPGRVGGAAARIAVQRIGPGDADRIAEAYWRSYAAAGAGFTRQHAREDIDRYVDGWHGPPLHDASWLVPAGAQAVGAVLVVRPAPSGPSARGPFVTDLFVVPERRRRGIGTALMTAALEAVGDEPVGLRVEPDDVGARRLYEALGFRVVGGAEQVG